MSPKQLEQSLYEIPASSQFPQEGTAHVLTDHCKQMNCGETLLPISRMPDSSSSASEKNYAATRPKLFGYHKFSLKILLSLRASLPTKLQWKNPPAKPTEAYQPTLIEQMANIVSHGACILPAVYATLLLIQRATTPTQFWAGLIYGIALVLLFTVSAAFHTTCCLCNNSKIREVLHRGDRAMIYIFIASSYFPWLSLVPNVNITAEVTNKSSSSLLPTLLSWCGVSSLVAADLRWLVWFLAAMGILYQQIFHEKYKWLETLIYVLIGLLPSLPFVHGDEFQGVWELKLGGACYIIGLIFFKADGRIPLAHAIWHIHVALGASIHYYAVFSYLIG